MLSALEDIADWVNPRAIYLLAAAIMSLVMSLFLIDSNLKNIGFLLMCGSMWSFGLYLLSCMYSRSDTDWSTGEATPTSRIRQQGSFRRAIWTAFASVWFLGSIFFTISLLSHIVK